MENNYYTSEKSQQIVLALLKAYGIKKVVASAGTTNYSIVASMQHDSWFEMYSSVDERSAAYIACGLAQESGEPVVITCTEATASRNYMPGLTEAYYRKLPILAITGSHGFDKHYHRIPQSIDRSNTPNDICNLSVSIPICKSKEDESYAVIQINRAIHALKRHGGGPVHIDIETTNLSSFTLKSLPNVRKIDYYTCEDELPMLPQGSIGVFCGSHRKFTDKDTAILDAFCESNKAIVFCDHTSNYFGKYRVNFSLVTSQNQYSSKLKNVDLLVHIGETSGDYFSLGVRGKQVWRVNGDGELRDTFHTLSAVFEMSENTFFTYYTKELKKNEAEANLNIYRSETKKLQDSIPELPYSNVWMAQLMADKLPKDCTVHFSILNSLRAWNFFEIPGMDSGGCNVGGFGIDGSLSTLLGASLANPNKICYVMTGDLAFFYDMNALGNRHINRNIRILLVNNGKGNEFRLYWHPASIFGEETDKFIGGGGHYGQKSKSFVKHYAEDLGFEYLTASNKEEYLDVYEKFLAPELTERPMLFEVFTETEEENEAVYLTRNCVEESGATSILSQLKKDLRNRAKDWLGDELYEAIKNRVK